MAWQRKAGHERIDLKTGMHIIPLHCPDSGAEHLLQINIGHGSCPHCGGVEQNKFAETYNPHAEVEAAIAALNESHKRQREYAERHKVKIVK